MNKSEKASAIKRYEDKLAKFGYSPKTVGWRDKEQQELRFKILQEIGDLDGRSILDIGCGFGDFYDFLVKKGLKIDYTGYDISPRIINRAKKRHPHVNFEVKDISIEHVNVKFDYVFESGIFNHQIADNIKYAKKTIVKMFELCNIGIGFNMVTNYVDFEEDHLFYYSPEQFFKFAKKISRFVTLKHDYPLYEFTIYIHKKFEKK